MPVSIQTTQKLSWPFAAIANFSYALKIKGLFCILNVVFFMLHFDFYKIHQHSNKDHSRLREANFHKHIYYAVSHTYYCYLIKLIESDTL